MGETAFDLKPEAPRRTEIDPLKTIDALRVGLEICFKAGYEPDKTNLQHIIWALMVEASRTERAMSAPKGKGYGNGWPEVVHSAADHFAARASRLESGLPEYELTYRPTMPTAAQISRHGEVMVWLRFCHADDKLRARDILWGRASGRRYDDLKAETGLTTERLRSIKSEQLSIIARRIKKELSGHNWEDAVFS